MKATIFEVTAAQLAVELCAQEKGRYALDHLSAEPCGMVATNGRTLVVLPYGKECKRPTKQTNFCARLARAIRKLLPDRRSVLRSVCEPEDKDIARIALYKNNGHVTVKKFAKDGRQVGRITVRDEISTDGQYPDWKAVMPGKDLGFVAAFDPAHLIAVLKALQPFTNLNSQAVQIRLHPTTQHGVTCHSMSLTTKDGAFGLVMPIEVKPEEETKPDWLVELEAGRKE